MDDDSSALGGMGLTPMMTSLMTFKARIYIKVSFPVNLKKKRGRVSPFISAWMSQSWLKMEDRT